MLLHPQVPSGQDQGKWRWHRWWYLDNSVLAHDPWLTTTGYTKTLPNPHPDQNSHNRVPQ